MSQVYLVGIDCSDCSSRALEHATAEALEHKGKLLIAHVIEWSPYSFNTNEENAQRHKRREAEIERAQAEIVNPIVKDLKEKGIDADGAVRHGHIAKTLIALADENDATAIIVGRHGDAGFLSQFFGSVPGALIQAAGRPVTVVP